MHITHLTLAAHDLYAANDFYAVKLGLPLLEIDEESITFQIGTTELTFRAADTPAQYHIAFNIPENQIEAGYVWLNQVTQTLLTDTGEFIAAFESWNAHSVYAIDPLGNVIELIARHGLHNGVRGAFTPESLLCVSEIGIPVDDVITAADDVAGATGDGYYLGEVSEVFTAVGDEHGLLIIVPRGREWYPQTGIPAYDVPLRLGVQGGNGAAFDLIG
jgi:catechol 2,3-dioxygenase-like lactoylglutathione lyase family enzyme